MNLPSNSQDWQSLDPTVVANFFAKLKTERRGFLILDYDGTLAPFHVDRYQARMAPGIEERLQRIVADGQTRIAFVTGRPIREIRSLVNLPVKLEIWGCHGREYTDGISPASTHGVTAADEELLREAYRLALDVVDAQYVETKIGCVAIHWRPLSDGERQRIRTEAIRLWETLRHPIAPQIDVFDGGVELSIAGRSKGDALTALLQNVDTNQIAVASLGDDWSDENGFRAMGERGLRVLVKDQLRETAADLRITLPSGVLQFLDAWIDTLSE